MASSSSEVSQIKYDVFISFRGTDTRRGFVSHLNKALCQKKINVYIDNKLEKGDEISTALLEAIERSHISLIVFSKDYAFSKWCMEELVKIMECLRRNGQVVMPIFYNINPSDVRNLKGSYGDAFSEYETLFEDSKFKVHNWSIVLKRAANLSGFHSSNFGTEAELIEQIVERVLKRLKYIYMGQNNPKALVGIHEGIAILESLLALESEVVRTIGIWGIGGIGKTTIAKELYDRLRFEYEACCFLPNAREKLEKYEVTLLQNEIVSALLEEKDQSIGIPIIECEYNMIRLRGKKVLLVLDDVNDLRKLKSLYGGRDWFGQGSRVIVTSRDKQVLTNIVDDTYEVKALKFEDSLQLFSLNAFQENYPKLEWRDLSIRAVNYAKGIPLALEVLGSSLYGKERKVWESQLEKLTKMPLPEIQNVLKLSYDGLDREEQDIFLFLACFFRSHDFDSFLLDACGYSTNVGLTNLHNKALIAVAKSWHPRYKDFKMCDLIRDMGLEIVRGESRELGKRRHLWDPNDVYQVLKNAMGTGTIQSLTLNMSNESKELHLSPKAFSGMFNLKFLKLDTCVVELTPLFEVKSVTRKMFAPKGLESIPDGLRILYWKGCPLKFLPSAFCAENLVQLDLSYSCLEKLWDGVQNLVNLKEIILKGCEQLMDLPDFSKTFNIELVVLSYCTSLRDLHPSILSVNNLETLYVDRCKKLKSLRSDIQLKSLRFLYARGCSSLKEFSLMSKSMGHLLLTDTGIVDVPVLGLPLNTLEHLNCGFSQNLIPHNFLQVLDLWELRKFTLDFFTPRYGLECLKELRLSGSNIENLPTSIKYLLALTHLYLRDCKMLKLLPELPPCIYLLDVSNCISLEEAPISSVSNCADSQYQAYFLFKNCFKLNQRTLNTIMLNAHVMMKRATYIQHLEPREWAKARTCGKVRAFWLPLREIPADKYHYRTTTEASMSIQFCSNSKSSLMGLIFCVVFSRCQLDGDFKFIVGFRCYLATSNGQQQVEFKCCFNDFGYEKSHKSIQHDLDHAFFWQDDEFCQRITEETENRSVNNQCTSSKLSFTIFTWEDHCAEEEALDLETEEHGNIEKQIKIKVWGICPVYASDLFTFSDKLAWGAQTKRARDTNELLDMEPLPPTKKMRTQ